MHVSLVIAAIAGLIIACGLLAKGGHATVRGDESTETQNLDPVASIERAALAKVDFLVGEWEGEGWSLSRSGERRRFWVSRGDILQPDGVWRQVMEFRMERVGS